LPRKTDRRKDGLGDLLPSGMSAAGFMQWGGARTTTVTTPLQIRNAAQQVAERLVTAIALGSVLPGQRFPPERELAQRLAVSRNTLRMALHELQADGYVTISKGRHGGARVASTWGPVSAELIRRTLGPLWERLEWVFDLDRGIGQLVARLAAERRSTSDLKELQARVDAFASPLWPSDEQDQADHAVHAAIAEATHNPFLVSLENQIWAELSLGVGILPSTKDLHDRAVIDHQELADAIADGDGELAAQINRRHFAELVETPLRQLRGRIVDRATPEGAEQAAT
jgi:GntR family transcriptional repressor for pyruvate dehydrogenase complex